MRVGIIWYRREDYDRLKAMFKDGEVLPDTFDDWVKIVHDVCAQVTSAGHVVVEVPIDPETFPEWCRAYGYELDAKARTEYALRQAQSTEGTPKRRRIPLPRRRRR